MHKPNTDSEKIFDNNNENNKAIKKLVQIKISDSPIILYILYLRYCSKVIIPQYSNVKNYKRTVNHWKRMIK